MSLAITREQRDAIYEVLINHLSGIGDVWMAVEQRDFATAKSSVGCAPRTFGCSRISGGAIASTARRSS